ncbi:hypothetical protein LEP1GSC024_4253 [Leptospira noguchii str. 2001034031]|uniref:Uncharacterized protein n=1 Tax=Leptospira noguchii str. 2001034031 TaxID=1193053 RepID=M6Y5G2_9LEPT|nr:hypothetical protein LEP1GSC024_4253 [Leptospira noguchii str. 2001034031]
MNSVKRSPELSVSTSTVIRQVALETQFYRGFVVIPTQI